MSQSTQRGQAPLQHAPPAQPCRSHMQANGQRYCNGRPLFINPLYYRYTDSARRASGVGSDKGRSKLIRKRGPNTIPNANVLTTSPPSALMRCRRGQKIEGVQLGTRHRCPAAESQMQQISGGAAMLLIKSHVTLCSGRGCKFEDRRFI